MRELADSRAFALKGTRRFKPKGGSQGKASGFPRLRRDAKGGTGMALMRWTPFGDLTTFRREMDRLFERFFGELPGLEIPQPGWVARLDLTETKDSVTVKAELPGLESKDLDISISGNTLTIKGEKRQEKEEKDEHRHLVERAYGAFTRVVELPAPVAGEKVKAVFKNGVLTITLPKTEEAKRKAIPIKVE